MGGPALQFVFVTGMKRSGTNWVAGLIASHRHATSWGEMHLEMVRDAVDDWCRPSWTAPEASDAPELAATACRALLEHLARRELARTEAAGAGRWTFVDHTPGWPARPIGGEGRHVHVIRDLRDVLVSDAYHSMRLGEYPAPVAHDQRAHIEAWREDPWHFTHHPDALLHPAEVDRLARTWVDIVTSARTLARSHPDDVLLIRYEDVHAAVEATTGALQRFCGLDAAGTVALASDLLPAFGGRGEDPLSIRRKGVVGDHRRYVTGEIAAAVDAIAGDLLDAEGYR